LGNKDGKLFNAAIFVLAKVIKNVMASAAEAEVGSLTVSSIWDTHNQPPK
jgi:hypothetical protein